MLIKPKAKKKDKCDKIIKKQWVLIASKTSRAKQNKNKSITKLQTETKKILYFCVID